MTDLITSVLIPLSGFLSGYIITKLSIDEVKGKSRILRYFLIACACLLCIAEFPVSLLSLFLVFFYVKRLNSWIPAFSASVIFSLFFFTSYLSVLLLFINNHLLSSAWVITK